MLKTKLNSRKMNTRIRMLTLLVCLFISSCNRNDDSYAINGKNGIALSDIIAFSGISSTMVNADSFSTASISVQLSPQTDSANRYVIFKTTLGQFANHDSIITVFANSNGAALTTLYGTIPGTTIINAYVGTISIDTIIQFTPALPDNMLLSADKYVVDSTDSIHVSSQLFRNNGRVSNGTFVYFTTSRGNNADSLIIPGFGISQNGSVNAILINPFISRGNFTVTAWTISTSNDTLRKSFNVLIK